MKIMGLVMQNRNFNSDLILEKIVILISILWLTTDGLWFRFHFRIPKQHYQPVSPK